MASSIRECFKRDRASVGPRASVEREIVVNSRGDRGEVVGGPSGGGPGLSNLRERRGGAWRSWPSSRPPDTGGYRYRGAGDWPGLAVGLGTVVCEADEFGIIVGPEDVCADELGTIVAPDCVCSEADELGFVLLPPVFDSAND